MGAIDDYALINGMLVYRDAPRWCYGLEARVNSPYAPRSIHYQMTRYSNLTPDNSLDRLVEIHFCEASP